MKAKSNWHSLTFESETNEEIHLLDSLHVLITDKIECHEEFINDQMVLTIETYQ